MTKRLAGVVTLAAAVLSTAAACAPTFIDESVATVDSSPGATTTTLLAVDPGAPLGELVAEIGSQLVDLDDQIVDDDGAAEQTLDRVLQLWAVAEPQIRSNDPDDVFNFEQAIELARTGVERLRPADASKGYRIWRNVADAYDA